MRNLQEVIDIGDWLVYVNQRMFTVQYVCVHPVYQTIIFEKAKKQSREWLEEKIEKQKSL